VKIRRNEGLDITVYAYAAAIRAGIDRVDWDRAEGKARQEKPKKPKPQVRESRW
jgi:phage terminase large subunit GpA-like protein